MTRLSKIRKAVMFWDQHRHTVMNQRQLKLVMRLIDKSNFSEGISRRKYKHLVSTSDATAARDLIDLLSKKILHIEGQGKATRYFINLK